MPDETCCPLPLLPSHTTEPVPSSDVRAVKVWTRFPAMEKMMTSTLLPGPAWKLIVVTGLNGLGEQDTSPEGPGGVSFYVLDEETSG
jgi:hypothetical protein